MDADEIGIRGTREKMKLVIVVVVIVDLSSRNPFDSLHE